MRNLFGVVVAVAAICFADVELWRRLPPGSQGNAECAGKQPGYGSDADPGLYAPGVGIRCRGRWWSASH